MKEKFKMAAEKTEELLENTGSTLENFKDKVDDKSTDLLKTKRKTEILEEVKAKLGISKKEENLLQKADPVLTQAKDHVEVRTEQWVKEVGLRRDQLMNDLGERTNHLKGKVKKSKPVKKLKEKAGEPKKHNRHAMKMSAHKDIAKN